MSSGLLFLSKDDFMISKGTKGNILCHGIPNFSLILFYSTQCVYCQQLIPIFKKLPGTIGGCQFGMINVQTNKDVVHMSKQTIAPIKWVPLIILYVNGRPFFRYDGPPDINTIREFVVAVAKKVQGKQQFTTNKVKDTSGRMIPEYCRGIGEPLYGDKSFNKRVCYLDFSNAYGN